MKNFIFKSLLATCMAGIAIVCTPKSSVAQVDMSLLTEVADNCQKDAYSDKYYQQLGHTKKEIYKIDDKEKNILLQNCIRARYFYALVIFRFPWLASTDELIPEYSGSVAIAQIAHTMYPNFFMANRGHSSFLQPSYFLDCLISKDVYSDECNSIDALGTLQGGSDRHNDTFNLILALDKYDSRAGTSVDEFFAFLSPSYYVNHNHYKSEKKTIAAFMEWFMRLEIRQRKDLMSILGEEQFQQDNRQNMKIEAYNAWKEYETVRQRIAEEDKKQRRRELFGE